MRCERIFIIDDKYIVEDFANVLFIKNQLELLTKEQLAEFYSNYDNFIFFLDTMAVLSEIDSAFLLYKKEYLEKIKTIINLNRSKCKDKEIISVINDIICYINEIDSYSISYKNILKNNYLGYHEECRKMEFKDEKIFLESLAYDAITYFSLVNNSLENLEGYDEYFLASINYFLKTIPEFFKDELIRERVNKKLNEIIKKGRPFNKYNRLYSKMTKESLEKVKVKEEY